MTNKPSHSKRPQENIFALVIKFSKINSILFYLIFIISISSPFIPVENEYVNEAINTLNFILIIFLPYQVC